MEMKIRQNGKDNFVHAEKTKGILWVHLNGVTHSIELNPKKKRNKHGGSSLSDIIEAPMPGKVTKILVSEGQVVSAGQVVLVMEAMKMEYTLKAEVEGKVLKINSKVSEQVPLGKVLIQLEEINTNKE